MNVNAGIETTMLIVFGVLVVGLGTVGVLRTRRKLRQKAILEAETEGANLSSGASSGLASGAAQEAHLS
jgi:hypothetical protein